MPPNTEQLVSARSAGSTAAKAMAMPLAPAPSAAASVVSAARLAPPGVSASIVTAPERLPHPARALRLASAGRGTLTAVVVCGPSGRRCPAHAHASSQLRETTGLRSSSALSHLGPPSVSLTRCVLVRPNWPVTFAPSSVASRPTRSRRAASW
ncbi:hypothetical protein T492DRAFT_1074928 [Pavlovales sp. CCMP2436]|nr:hypothetical protein T492DRAFT_1074928 [Pavlovales sp. CCMP2436]